jgi:translation elongation factor EF-Ts
MGMMECKKALTDAAGVVDDAVDLLRERHSGGAGSGSGQALRVSQAVCCSGSRLAMFTAPM